eukprot:867110_1
MGPLVRCHNDIYTHQQIHNDFLHIKMHHIDRDKPLLFANEGWQDISTILHDKFCKSYECDGSEDSCFAFLRRHRDHDNINICLSLSDDKIRNEKEWILQTECDKIHSYFLHSTIAFPFPNTDVETSTKQRLDIEKQADHKVDRCFSAMTCVSHEDVAPSATEEEMRGGYVGEKEDMRWLNEIDAIENDDDVYRLLVENMGLFRWQSVHGFRTGQNRALAHLKPKFKNVREEALNNSYLRASIDNWNSTLRTSKMFFQSWGRYRIKTLYDGAFTDQVTLRKETWQKGESITLREIVMLKLYTNFDKLQHELKKCFRWNTMQRVFDKHDDEYNEIYKAQMIKDDAQMKADLENRLSEFFHWRTGLLIAINKYGQKIDQHTMVLYHGVNSKMILNPAETMAFSGPLSTTSSYHVAKQFATAKGMVLKITSQYPRLRICRAFDASLISDYPEEQEYLIGSIYMRVLEVRTRPITTNIMDPELWKKAPLASKMRVVFFCDSFIS